MKMFKSTDKENQTLGAAAVTGFLLSNFNSKQSKGLPSEIITSFLKVFKMFNQSSSAFLYSFSFFPQVVSVNVVTAALKPQ